MAVVSFLDDVLSIITTTNNNLSIAARIVWVLLIPVSIYAWIRVFQAIKSRLFLFLMAVSTLILCNYSYLGVGLTSDLFIGKPRPTSVGKYEMELALFGALTLIFFVLCIAASFVLVRNLFKGKKIF